MAQQLETLWQPLKDLKKRAPVLSQRLSQAAQTNDVIVSDNLADDLATYHKDFENLRTQVLELAATSLNSLPPKSDLVSLNDLEKLLLQAELAKIPVWHHCIDLGHGVITPGGSGTSSPHSEQRIGLPDNLEGITVLDIGAWDGFYSFAAERRGASRVLATDSYVWEAPHFGKGGFELVRNVLDSHVEDMHIDVLDLSPEKVGVFDLVLFLGVLYHMRHPLLALERVFSVTGKQLILETHVDMLDYPKPAMVFYPGDELNRDATNWCGPNALMVQAMLETVGFRDIKLVNTSQLNAGSARMVFHAWR